MTRVKRGVNKKRRHKKILQHAKGFQGRASKCYRIAKERVEKGWQHAYRDRRNKKRTFRALWIQRINAAVRELGFTYSRFMEAIQKAGIDFNRKVLSELAIRDPENFSSFVKEIISK